MSRLTIRNLYRTYTGQHIALKDFGLEVKDGELVAIVGPSECGKSVLLRIIAGLETSTEGAIWLDEQLINETNPKARQIAMVLQNYMLYPEMNILENLAFGLKLLKFPPSKLEGKVKEIASELGVEQYLYKMPSDLTPVEYFKIVLVRALVKEPRLLLLDNPLEQIKAEHRFEALEELKKLQKKTNVTTLFVTNNAKEAFLLGDRIGVMKEGELLQLGTSEEILERPLSMSVAGATMLPIMSFAEREVVDKGNHLEMVIFGETHILDKEIEAILRKKGYVNQPVILGVRPDDVMVAPSVDDSTEQAVADVKYLKVYDGKEYAYFDYNSGAFAGRIKDGVVLAPEDKIVISYKNTALLLFNKDTGEAILYDR